MVSKGNSSEAAGILSELNHKNIKEAVSQMDHDYFYDGFFDDFLKQAQERKKRIACRQLFPNNEDGRECSMSFHNIYRPRTAGDDVSIQKNNMRDQNKLFYDARNASKHNLRPEATAYEYGNNTLINQFDFNTGEIFNRRKNVHSFGEIKWLSDMMGRYTPKQHDSMVRYQTLSEEDKVACNDVKSERARIISGIGKRSWKCMMPIEREKFIKDVDNMFFSQSKAHILAREFADHYYASVADHYYASIVKIEENADHQLNESQHLTSLQGNMFDRKRIYPAQARLFEQTRSITHTSFAEWERMHPLQRAHLIREANSFLMEQQAICNRNTAPEMVYRNWASYTDDLQAPNIDLDLNKISNELLDLMNDGFVYTKVVSVIPAEFQRPATINTKNSGMYKSNTFSTPTHAGNPMSIPQFYEQQKMNNETLSPISNFSYYDMQLRHQENTDGDSIHLSSPQITKGWISIDRAFSPPIIPRQSPRISLLTNDVSMLSIEDVSNLPTQDASNLRTNNVSMLPTEDASTLSTDTASMLSDDVVSILPRESSISGASYKMNKYGRSKKRTDSSKPVCKFCMKNGELGIIYEAHTMRDEYDRVICPVLLKHKCEICGATGLNAHTRKYCPQNTEAPVELPSYRLLTNGSYSISHNHK